MKKIIAFVLTVMLLGLAGAALAEREVFTLYNGIRIGDSMEQVKALETLPFSSDNSNETVLAFETTTAAGAGIEAAEGHWYRFDEDVGLWAVIYQFMWLDDEDTHRHHVEQIEAELEQNYGSPLDIPVGSRYAITGLAYTLYDDVAYIVNDVFVIELTGCGEWVIDTGCDYVKIDHISFYISFYSKEGDGCTYLEFLSYRRFTEEELAEAIREQREETSVIDNAM